MALAAQTPPPAAPAPQYKPTNINFGMGAMVPSQVQWQPLSTAERKKLFINDAFLNPRSIGTNILWAAIDLSNGQPEEWRQGMAGYGMRVASRYGRSFVGNLVQHGGAALLGTEIRYVRAKSRNPLKRIGNAALWQFCTLNSSGRYVFDLPSVSAIYVQEMVGVQWMPGQSVSGYAIRSANQQMVQGIAMNLVREFLPDLKRVFPRKKPSPPSVP